MTAQEQLMRMGMGLAGLNMCKCESVRGRKMLNFFIILFTEIITRVLIAYIWSN